MFFFNLFFLNIMQIVIYSEENDFKIQFYSTYIEFFIKVLMLKS